MPELSAEESPRCDGVDESIAARREEPCDRMFTKLELIQCSKVCGARFACFSSSASP